MPENDEPLTDDDAELLIRLAAVAGGDLLWTDEAFREDGFIGAFRIRGTAGNRGEWQMCDFGNRPDDGEYWCGTPPQPHNRDYMIAAWNLAPRLAREVLRLRKRVAELEAAADPSPDPGPMPPKATYAVTGRVTSVERREPRGVCTMTDGERLTRDLGILASMPPSPAPSPLVWREGPPPLDEGGRYDCAFRGVMHPGIAYRRTVVVRDGCHCSDDSTAEPIRDFVVARILRHFGPIPSPPEG